MLRCKLLWHQRDFNLPMLGEIKSIKCHYHKQTDLWVISSSYHDQRKHKMHFEHKQSAHTRVQGFPMIRHYCSSSFSHIVYNFFQITYLCKLVKLLDAKKSLLQDTDIGNPCPKHFHWELLKNVQFKPEQFPWDTKVTQHLDSTSFKVKINWLKWNYIHITWQLSWFRCILTPVSVYNQTIIGNLV